MRREERYGGFLASRRNDRDLCATFLNVEDRIRRISLGKESLLWFQFNHSSSNPGAGQETFKVEGGRSRERHPDSPFRCGVLLGDAVERALRKHPQFCLINFFTKGTGNMV